ncbi:uncharacterized protein BDV14DRAFT_175945 [Aspergillus stella-maris]|uniref:uncharacterized protein n=1 Tax=Aspergillus stella-maris TaxID=1810926 RepID=UPI003CCDCF53
MGRSDDERIPKEHRAAFEEYAEFVDEDGNFIDEEYDSMHGDTEEEEVGVSEVKDEDNSTNTSLTS